MAARLPRSRRLTEAFIRDKCNYLVDVHMWPIHQVIDPQPWLSNFEPDELDHASHLLNGFMYFTDHLIDRCVEATVRSLSRLVCDVSRPSSEIRAAWTAFCSRALVTYPTGEEPSPTDSGPEYVRRARHRLGLAEPQFVEPVIALAELIGDPTVPIIFVDDFVGTGNQFLVTWHREYEVGARRRSFADSVAPESRIFYAPILCTELGHEQIRSACPSVHVSPAHVLSSRYSVFSPDSIIWPDDLRHTAEAFVEQASKRAGIPDSGGMAANDWRGFAKLGLTVALYDSVPDATIPLLYWEENGWKPLIRRR